MSAENELPVWKPQLDAIVGARHGGQVARVREQLIELNGTFPFVPEVIYQLAWTCDVLGHSSEAIPYYEQAIALGLESHELSGALLGLGSSLRDTGQPERSGEVLASGQLQFPGNHEFTLFLALAQHEAGQSDLAVANLLEVLLETSEDIAVTAYQRALRQYLEKIRHR